MYIHGNAHPNYTVTKYIRESVVTVLKVTNGKEHIHGHTGVHEDTVPVKPPSIPIKILES